METGCDRLKYAKPPSDEGGVKTQVLTEGEKGYSAATKVCCKTSLPQSR